MRVFDQYDTNQDAIHVAKIMRTRNLVKQLELVFNQLYKPAIDRMVEASEWLCQENDFVIGHFLALTLVPAALKFKCPRVAVHLSPNSVASKHLSPTGNSLSLPLNWLAWQLVDYLFKNKVFPFINDLYRHYGLPAINNFNREVTLSEDLNLIAASKALFTTPNDWSDNIHTCGFLDTPLLTENWRAPQGLYHFIENGPAPLFFTFGSYTQYNNESATKLFLDTARETGQRAIIQSNWDKISFAVNDANIFKIENCPHHEIFPLCAAVVHHGGAGTTQSALRSGCPSVVVAHAFDQFYWGARLYKLAVAPKILHRRNVTKERLAEHIFEVMETPEYGQSAHTLANQMQQENGVANAVELINRYFDTNVPTTVKTDH